jgi:hypothetical protein
MEQLTVRATTAALPYLDAEDDLHQPGSTHVSITSLMRSLLGRPDHSRADFCTRMGDYPGSSEILMLV